MKRIKNILLPGLIVFALSGCENFLTTTPTTSLSATDYWRSDRNVEAWMNGIYNGLLDITGDLRYYGEGRSDNLFPSVYSPGTNFQMNALTSTGSNERADWEKFYTVIARCNIALDKIPSVDDIPVTKKEMYYAECHGIRALMYFYIVRLWGAVPLLLEPWDFQYETRYNERASVESVAAAIEDDILKSDAYFDAQGERESSEYYFTSGAALALQMDFYAWRGRFADVLKAYEKFTATQTDKGLVDPVAGWATTATINSTEWITWATKAAWTTHPWKAQFIAPEKHKEAVFSLVYDPANEGSPTFSFYAGTLAFSGSNSPFALGRDMYLLMVQDFNDIRLGGVVATGAPGSNNAGSGLPLPSIQAGAAGLPVYGAGQGGVNDNIQRVDKFRANTGFGQYDNSNLLYYFPTPIYRYADVRLLYIEALNRVDEANAGTVIDLINEFRASRGSTVVFDVADYPVQLGRGTTSREKLIMDERQLEFYGEPKRWFDLLRLDWGYEVIDTHVSYLQANAGQPAIGFGDRRRMLFPIAQKNLTNNSKLVQNPGY